MLAESVISGKMQKIEIRNFGPIRDLTINVKDFSLLIGPQASGKSTVAKTIYFFKSLNDDLKKYFINSFETRDFSKFIGVYGKSIRQKFLDYFGTSFYLKDLHLKYYYSEAIWISITLEPLNKYITPNFSQKFVNRFKRLVGNAETYAKGTQRRNPAFLTTKDLIQVDSERKIFLAKINEQVDALFNETRELFFIPAGRSLLATLSDQIQYINARNLDFLTRSFVDRINLVRPLFNKSLDEIVEERRLLTNVKIDRNRIGLAESYITRILKGQYRYDREGEKILYDNDNYVRLNLSSSGQQESLWILLLIFLLILENTSVFIVIEEPEAHLYPEAQKEIVNLIALLCNQNNSQIIITTHSPYILASFNNLIFAYKVGQKNEKIVNAKINKAIWLNTERVFAAKVGDGKLRDIIDPEFHIIDSEQIDTASTMINSEFDFLFQHDQPNA